jgi:propanol-preferring alcohol dehydrogenase
LWGERSLRSVANLTRRDGDEFFAAIARHPLVSRTRTYALADANLALTDLREGRVQGAAVLIPAGRDSPGRHRDAGRRNTGDSRLSE